ncbi:DnaJ-domain-containing protein [Aaosphaeria arxii CBS 175.79]|uniref:DnaJ-domain-containing protein n=1 Tax=Aaosphaeria arxii CBS 175.79 TaxID=1450172 RepID=A0A6A5XV23_9PLEO|nr:DnaJ-domain-containing protein [Aaosphaeria arxii CBS 175.79]KAF2016094.1 DnaJ-domain-containing protein [Aaosphaeria arxii CBS 175.79]
MATVQINLPLPVLPEGWAGEKDFKPISQLSAANDRNIEPVGPHFLAHARRKRHKRTFSEDDRIQAQANVKKVEDDDEGEISEPEDPVLLQREAKDWKNQDHYAVLGIARYRHRATEEQIKKAHRRKVLKHHPDKKAAAGGTEDDQFFKCIQKATEVLLDPVKRRQFDSVDEAAEVEPPTKKETQKGNFYKLWGKVFESEGRFSNNQPVPKLGNEKSTKPEVEAFYNFWYNFDSWRSFEYLDEDVPDDNENRDQKRHVERKNQNARRKKKTEDTTRLRKLVDDALALDERIKKFRQEEHAQKNKRRFEKEAEQKRLAEEAAKAKEEAARLQQEKEAAEKAEKAEGKKAKEAAKNAAKKNKRVVRGAVKDANYFHAGGDAPAAQIDSALNDVDLIITKIDNEELATLTGKLNGQKDGGVITQIFQDEVKRLVGAGKLKDGEAKSLSA